MPRYTHSLLYTWPDTKVKEWKTTLHLRSIRYGLMFNNDEYTVQYTMRTLSSIQCVHWAVYNAYTAQCAMNTLCPLYNILKKFHCNSLKLNKVFHRPHYFKIKNSNFLFDKKIIWKYLFSDICTQSNTKISKNRRWGVTVR